MRGIETNNGEVFDRAEKVFIYPLVSIITPSFNQGKYIEDTFLSIKDQDYSNIEHFVVDGGSTDKTLEILKKYERLYHLRWVSEPDEGQSDAINKGFQIVQGDIVGWLNSDDCYYSKDVISHIVLEFIKNPNLDVIYGDNIYIDENNNFLGLRKMVPWRYDYALCGIIPSQPSAFFRKNIVKKYKLRKDLNFAMDLDFWLRIGKEYKIKHINKILSCDRLHVDTKRNRLRDAGKKEHWTICKYYGQNFDLIYLIKRYLIYFPILFILRLVSIKQLILEDFKNATIPIKQKNKLFLVIKQLLFINKEIFSRLRD